MSDVRQMKVAVHQLAQSAQQTASGLAQFQQRFSQQGAQVQHLIGGTAPARISASPPWSSRRTRR